MDRQYKAGDKEQIYMEQMKPSFTILDGIAVLIAVVIVCLIVKGIWG